MLLHKSGFVLKKTYCERNYGDMKLKVSPDIYGEDRSVQRFLFVTTANLHGTIQNISTSLPLKMFNP